MPDTLYRDDAFYKKGHFHVTLDIVPKEGEEVDEKARLRALQQLLLALKNEVGLKVSSFVDVYDEGPEEDDLEVEVDEEPQEHATAEFVVFNKLGVTSLSKLRRFMEEHLQGDLDARMILIDPKSQQRYEARDFTIRYLFHDFVAGDPKNNWDHLKEYLQSEDKGYGALASQKNAGVILYRGHRYARCEGGRVYTGPPPRGDDTDRQTKPASTTGALVPIVEKFIAQKQGEPVYLLDFGAGRFARNADFFRRQYGDAVEVWAYDPFKANSEYGFEEGAVADYIPDDVDFDLLYSMFVLNVVTDEIESDILADSDSVNAPQIHIVRDDLRTEARGWLRKHSPVAVNWFMDQFATPEETEEFEATDGLVSKETIQEFVCFGVETRDGFQREPNLAPKGYREYARRTGKWVAWTKGI